MAKRFTSTEIWDEDWFLEMPNEYKLFWYYVLSSCDHAGFFKVNLRSFCSLLEVKVSPIKALEWFNDGKLRVKEIQDSVWFIPEFFAFQYGHTFNINNPLHRGVKKLLDKYEIQVTSLCGLKEVILTTKEKDKEKEIIIDGGVGEDQKSKSKINGNTTKQFRNFKSQGEDILAERIAARTQKIANSNRKKDNLQKD